MSDSRSHFLYADHSVQPTVAEAQRELDDFLEHDIDDNEEEAAKTASATTSPVVMSVSRRVGHTTFEASERTCWIIRTD